MAFVDHPRFLAPQGGVGDVKEGLVMSSRRNSTPENSFSQKGMVGSLPSIHFQAFLMLVSGRV